MGSFGAFKVDGTELFSTKNYVDGTLTMVFSVDEWRQVEGELDGYRHWSAGFRSTGTRVADRLDIMGFTVAEARKKFERGLSRLIRERERSLPAADDWFREHLGKELHTLQQMSFDRWTKATQRRHPSSRERPPESLLHDDFMHIAYDSDDSFCGYPLEDQRYLLRALLDLCPADAPVEYDVSDLVNGGWVEPDEDGVEDVRTVDLYRWIAPKIAVEDRLVVLTEGHTDVRVLRGALSVIYPHLVPYVSFMDFEGANAAGGASQLVAMIKAFAGAGIRNRLVALFDNDTAATVARRGLLRTTVPDNIRIVPLPQTNIGANYPTIGPGGGIAKMNVNGLAGSIELYLGPDVLRDANGELTPVQWLGFDQTLKQYQGEVLNKAALQERFAAKVEVSKALGNFDPSAWEDMKAVLDAIRHAFL